MINNALVVLRASGVSLFQAAKSFLFSPPVRRVASKLSEVPRPHLMDQIFAHTPLAETLCALGSQPLPVGSFYLQLRIPNWEQFEGESFQLLYRTKLLYGNIVEPPEKGFPLEYRNIVANSKNAADFQVKIITGDHAGQVIPFELSFSTGAWCTPEQARYDARFKVRKHGNVYYSIRGNLENPHRVIFTFPGLSLSAGRIVYTLSYLQQLKESDLSDAVLVAFQDRYLVPGSYMYVDSLGNPITSDVVDTMKKILTGFKIDESNALLFGASKGGSSAIFYAQFFPQAQLLLSTPQLNLPSYFTKPALRDNLFLQDRFYETPELGQMLLDFMANGRRIDFLYTNNDELSNQSFVEVVNQGEHLNKYRLPGVHTAVAKIGMPTLMGIIRKFLHATPDSIQAINATVIDFSYPVESLGKLRLRLDEQAPMEQANWYLEHVEGSTHLRFLLSLDADRRTLFTGAEELFNEAVDSLSGNWRLLRCSADGEWQHGSIRGWSDQIVSFGPQDPSYALQPQPLNLDVKGLQHYWILNRYRLAHFTFNAIKTEMSNRVVDVCFGESDPQMPQWTSNADLRINIQLDDGAELADVFVMRCVARMRARKIRVFIDIAEDSLRSDLKQMFEHLGWKRVKVRIGKPPSYE